MSFTRYSGGWQGGGAGAFARGGLSPAVRMLLIANGVVFVLQMLAKGVLEPRFGLVPAAVAQGAVWQLFTYMFLHGGFLHILFNMLWLYWFGRDLEYQWGSRSFLKFYLICGIGAGLLTFAVQPTQMIPTIGASGAIFAVLLAFAMTWPNREITMLLFFVFPVTLKAKYLVGGLALIQILMLGDTGTVSNVAYITHIGGLASAFLYLKLGGRRIPFPFPLAALGRWRAKRRGRKLREKWDEQRHLMEEVDRVLDRINEVGFDQLTPEEKDTLERASQRLSGEKQKR